MSLKEDYKNKINMDAAEIINAAEEWEIACKIDLLKTAIETVNKICADNNLRYFARDVLLTLCLSSEDSYPDLRNYSIGMLRADYDIFITEVYKRRQDLQLGVHKTIGVDGAVYNTVASIDVEKNYEGKLGRIRDKISIEIYPYDAVPSSQEECKTFINGLQEVEYEYKQASREYLQIKQRAQTSPIYKVRKYFFRRQRLKEKCNKYNEMLRSNYGNDSKKVAIISFNQRPPLSIDDIEPMSEVDFRGIKVMIPSKVEKFAAHQSYEKTERVALTKIETLRRFDEICKKEGYSYFAGWDLQRACSHFGGYQEDMVNNRWDVCMLRNDYEEFIAYARANKNIGIRLLENEGWYSNLPSLVKGIVLEEYDMTDTEEFRSPICITPFDTLPDEFDRSVEIRRKARDAWLALEHTLAKAKGDAINKDVGDDPQKAYEYLRSVQTDFKGVGQRLFAMKNGAITTYDLQEVFPLTRARFNDIEISCANNPFLWRYRRDELYTEYISKQKTGLLKSIDCLCSDNDLRYFALANLVKAVSVYGDAQPNSNNQKWEIGLIRDEYETFKKCVNQSGEKYGLMLVEYKDDSKQMPVETLRVKEIGRRFSSAEIFVLPFDKIPNDFYLNNGFKKIMRHNNMLFGELKNSRSYLKRAPKAKTPNEDYESYQDYVRTANPLEEYKRIDALAQSFNDTERPFNYKRVAFSETKEIAPHDLFPLQRLKFRDIMVNCPKDYSVWQPVQDEELERQVKSIQRADIILLKEFDRVCQELGVGYFICGGTMLGYMRHKGFIPWDDDVDVAMLREDYDIFMKKAPEILSEKFFLQNRESDPNIPYLFSKIRLEDTEYITEYNELREFHKGICLDIFPFDYIPNVGKKYARERNAFVRGVIELSAMHNMAVNNQLTVPEEECIPVNDFEKECISVEKESLKKYWGVSLHETQEAYIKEATKYNDQAKELGLTTVGSFVPSYTYIDIDDLLPYQRGLFEGVEVNVPKRPDIFLEMQYGDYMELPPKHAQIAHRLLRWKTWDASGDNTHRDEEE